MERNIIAAVFGVSSGLTIMHFGQHGYTELMGSIIPWQKRPSGEIYWPMNWLVNSLRMAKSYAEKTDIVTTAMWGADLALGLGPEGGRACFPAQHYRSVSEEHLAQVTARVDPLRLYLETGGANVAFFQPPSQIMAEMERRPDSLERTKEIVPLADIMTFVLAGKDLEPKHDPVMLQSQGLLHHKAKQACYETFGQEITVKIAPWAKFSEQELIEDSTGVLITPVTHDSVRARMVGFTQCPWVLWTGSWIGTATSLAKHINVRPTPETYEAGVAFEGIGGTRAAITNIAMLGSVYKALKPSAWSYEDASERVLSHLDGKDIFIFPFSLEKMPQDIKGAASWVLSQNDNSTTYALTAVIKTAAQVCYGKIAATAKALGISPPDQVAIIGGWAKNRAFIAALESLGLGVLIPPLADCATHAGLAADALLRVGEAGTFAEALDMLTEQG